MKHETITAMLCIAILEMYALHQGIDGLILTTVIATLAGLGGFTLRKIMPEK